MNLIDRDGSREEPESAEAVLTRLTGASRVKAPKVVKKRLVWLRGKIAEWDDGRGFGWVLLDSGAEIEGKTKNRVFAHIRDFGKRSRPLVGDEVTFFVGQDAQGRSCAKDLRYLNKGLVLRSVGTGAFIRLMLLLVLPVLAGFKLPIPGWIFPCWLMVMSVVAWVTYRSDKKAAVNRAWRIPENKLHLIELLGGWPGAYLAQGVFRHKSAKLSYRIIFWGIVFLHQVAALDVVMDHWFSNELQAVLKKSLEGLSVDPVP